MASRIINMTISEDLISATDYILDESYTLLRSVLGHRMTPHSDSIYSKIIGLR